MFTHPNMREEVDERFAAIQAGDGQGDRAVAESRGAEAHIALFLAAKRR